MNRAMSVVALLLGALLVLLLLLTTGCAFWNRTGVKKDEAEAKREAEAEGRGRIPAGAPVVDLGPDGFGDSRLAHVGSFVAEGLVLAALAAAVTGIVRLYQRRLPLLGLLAAVVALLLAGLAFLKSWG